MIITLIAGIAVAALLAILIMKFVPLKLKWLVSIVLISVAGYLGYSIYNSIMAPIHFNIEKKNRYAKVIYQLRMIRDAQIAHKTITGRYEKNGENLIKFLDTAEFAITNTHNEIIQVNKGTKWQPIMIEVEKRVTDTTGYESVKETVFKNRDYKKMLNVPDTNTKFEITVGEIEKVAGLKVPVFVAKVDKEVILKGLDSNLIYQERESIGGDEVRGPFLSVGSLEEVNSNGNWPPFYDRKGK
ncbi:hypothetical protein [Flavicella sp.]|uniref:hypothetical protein n=1 Tax=Flavicella sp. TaxID=2957742 RepID=UPI0030186AA3